MINAKTAYPEIIFRLLDYMCEEKSAISSRWGKYGENWVYLSESDVKVTEDNCTCTLYGLDPVFVIKGNPWGDPNNLIWRNDTCNMLGSKLYIARVLETASTRTPGQIAVGEIFGEGVRERQNYLPDEIISKLVLTEEEQEQLAEIKTSIDGYATEQRVAFITGTVDIATGWDAYVETLNAMGLQTYVDIAQTAWTRMNAN